MTLRRLSIALPVHNGADYLAPTLESILSQTFGDFDVFVSENASTDGTADILADYGRRDRRIRVFPTDELLPQVDNINRAVSLAHGDWVKIQCHDDLMRSSCMAEISSVLDLANENRVGLIGNGETYLFPNGFQTDAVKSGKPSVFDGREALIQIFSGTNEFDIPATTTATVRKAAFDSVGGWNKKYRYLVDAFCWYEIMVGYNYLFIPSSLTVNRIHDRQSAAVMSKQLVSVQDLRAFLPDFLRRHRDVLNLPLRTRLRVRAKPAAEGARKVAGELFAGRNRSALHMMNSLPRFWLPILIPLIVRALYADWIRMKTVENDVPKEMLCP